MKPYRFEQLEIGANVYRKSDNLLIGKVEEWWSRNWVATLPDGAMACRTTRQEAAEWLTKFSSTTPSAPPST